MAKKDKKVESIALDEQLTKSEAFIEKNLKSILIAIAAVIVVVAGIFIYRNHMANVELEAQNAIAKSQTAFAQDQFEQALNGDGANDLGFLNIKMFEDFDARDDQMVSPAALAALGNCYVKNGDSQKGAETLVKAAQKADNDAVSPLALRQAGEIYESLNQPEKALELYQQIKDKYFRSPLAGEIDKYIERVSK